MRVSAIIQDVEEEGICCNDCLEDRWSASNGKTWDEVRKSVTFSKGAVALKLTVDGKPGGTIYLCIPHAECLVEDIARQLPT